MKLYTFTPQTTAAQRKRYKLQRLYPTSTWDTRVTMRVSFADRAALKGGSGNRAAMRDRKSGQTFLVESVPCGLRCHCAARIVRKIGARK